jgi:protein-disulfide isomerase
MSTLKTVLAAVLVIATIALSAAPASTQSSEELKALRQELEAIKEGQGRLQKDVQEIKAILQGARAAAQPPQVQPQNVVLTLDGEPAKGDKSARVVLVEFTDYQCPFCGRYVRDAYAQIEAEYIKTGKLRYVIREFPLESIHPQAFKAAEAALCAGDQGKYWEMHDRLFANQRALAPEQLSAHAQAVGADGAKFDECLQRGVKVAKVRKDLDDGLKAGVTGTPAFFVGVADGGTVKVARVVKGAVPFAAFKEAIDAVLAAK